MRHALFSILLLGALASGCGYAAKQGPVASPPSTIGANPVLPPPKPQGPIPTVNIASVVGWKAGEAPTPAPGFAVTAYATGLAHPRWLYVLPNGDVLVAQASTQARKASDVNAVAENEVQEAAGAIHDSANTIDLLRDSDGDGVVDLKTVLVGGLFQPFGMAFASDTLYVANTDEVVAFPYKLGETKITAKPRTILKLPYNEADNHHWTRSLLASPDGKALYVSVGSASNIADRGMAIEQNRAAILEFNPDGSGMRVFASGLRNPNGLSWNPETGALWAVVNERDALGDDLVPDYMTSVKKGAFYGWPWSYWGGHVDARVKPQNPDMVAKAIAPDYALGAHTASLGLTFYQGDLLPAHYRNGAFIGQHGSWNRSRLAGYKVVFVPFAKGAPAGPMEDILTGFVDDNGKAHGRPVGVAVDKTGALLVADDVGNAIWRVAPKP
jgi:glucose/arabinose dehydrogenase